MNPTLPNVAAPLAASPPAPIAYAGAHSVVPADRPSSRSAGPETCSKGHVMDDTNVRIDFRGRPECWTCRRINRQKYRQNRRARERGEIPAPVLKDIPATVAPVVARRQYLCTACRGPINRSNVTGICMPCMQIPLPAFPGEPAEPFHGSPRLPHRFWVRVLVAPDGCWQWVGAKNNHGYGRVRLGGGDDSAMYAHRAAYMAFWGPIPEGLQLDHLCRNRSCCNPDHLEPVTPAENSRRGLAGRQSHCQRGHELTDDNVKVTAHGCRSCRQCARDRDRARFLANRPSPRNPDDPSSSSSRAVSRATSTKEPS